MEYINKCNQSVFHPFYTRFENNKWITVNSQYSSKYNYKGLRDQIYNDIKFTLIDEQNGLCCYCMKMLEKNDSSTIEHLFPNNPQSHNIFANYSLACIDKRNFDYSIRNIPNANLINLPHDISYYNLLACCSDCNGNRGTKELKPFVFDSNVKSKFGYDNNGNIFSKDYENEIINIGLATERYVNFRRLWKYIASKHPNIVSFDYRSLEKIIKTSALEMYNTTKSLFYIDFTMNGLLVKEAFQYRYFYNN